MRRQVQSRYPTADLPHVAKPDVEDLAARRGDVQALQVLCDRVMDQFYLLVTASKLLDRSVENYRDLQDYVYWERQREARGKAGDDASGDDQDTRRPIFEFDVLSSKYLNSVQEESMKDYLNSVALPVYNKLRENGCVATHLCQRSEDFDFYNERFSPDNTAPHVYHEGVRDKYGSAAKGNMRLTHMREDHRAWDIAPPRTYSVVDIANLPLDGQLECVDYLLKELKRFKSPQLPTTLREMLVQDMQGPSVGSQILFRSLVEPYDSQQILTGGIALRGSLTATFRNTIESGAQQKADRLGAAQVGDKHEFLRSEAFAVGTAHLRNLQDITENLLTDLEEDGLYQSNKAYHEEPITAAWKTGTLTSTPHLFWNAKVAVMRAISRIEGPGYFTNAFGDHTPHAVSTNIDDCYDCANFTEEQRKGAIAKNEAEVLVPLERDGNYFVIVDVCEEAYKIERKEYLRQLRRDRVAIPDNNETGEERRYPSALYALLARDTSESFGLSANSPNAPKWRIYEKDQRNYDHWATYGFIAMTLESNDKKLRLINLVAPWCRWMMCKKGVRMGMGQMEDAFRSACASTFSGLVLDAVCSERTTVNRSLDRPVSEIPVVLFSVLSLHMNQFMHLIVRNINVLIKSWLTGENQLNRKYTNLLREKHVRVVSRAPRSALLRSEHKVANLPDGDDSDEEAEEDDGEDGSVCSDDGAWSGTTCRAPRRRRRKPRRTSGAKRRRTASSFTAPCVI